MADKIEANFIISENAWNKIQQYAGLAHTEDQNEISGICLVRKIKHPVDDREVWELFEPCILKQENSTSNTILDKEVLPEYYIDMAMKHGDKIRYCWWHSHHTMSAFWSATDQTEIKAWKNSSWSLALVVNLFHDYCLNVTTWDPIEHSEDVPLEIIRNVPEPTAEMIKEYKEKCSDIVHTVSSVYKAGYGYGSYNGQLSMIHSTGIAKDFKLTWDNKNSVQDFLRVFSETKDGLDDLNGEYITDRLQYAEYKTKVQACNKRLKEINARFKIKILTKTKLHEACMHDEPSDFFEYDSNESEMTYESCIAQAEVMEAAEYNAGWIA